MGESAQHAAMSAAAISAISAWRADRIEGRAIVVAALDNLTKGSSGQALQNANLMLGIQETEGLMLAPVFP